MFYALHQSHSNNWTQMFLYFHIYINMMIFWSIDFAQKSFSNLKREIALGGLHSQHAQHWEIIHHSSIFTSHSVWWADIMQSTYNFTSTQVDYLVKSLTSSLRTTLEMKPKKSMEAVWQAGKRRQGVKLRRQLYCWTPNKHKVVQEETICGSFCVADTTQRHSVWCSFTFIVSHTCTLLGLHSSIAATSPHTPHPQKGGARLISLPTICPWTHRTHGTSPAAEPQTTTQSQSTDEERCCMRTNKTKSKDWNNICTQDNKGKGTCGSTAN